MEERKFDQSESDSSPEKVLPTVGRRKSLRELQGRATNYSRPKSQSPVNSQKQAKQLQMENENIDLSLDLSKCSSTNENIDEYSAEEGDQRRSPRLIAKKIRHETPARSSPSFEVLRSKTPAPPESSISDIWIYVVIIVVLAITVTVFSNSKSGKNFEEGKADCSQFLELKNSFPNQDQKLFRSLKTGIEGVVNEDPAEPSVFALFSTDDSVIERMMKEVIKVTMQCINLSQDPIVLTKEQLNDKLVVDYKDELAKRTIMIINNVDEASASSVQSLHSFCDTYNPLVSRAIIFFTIHVPQAPSGKPVEYITEYLNDRWKDLAENIRGPLIARMIDQTFFVKP